MYIKLTLREDGKDVLVNMDKFLFVVTESDGKLKLLGEKVNLLVTETLDEIWEKLSG